MRLPEREEIFGNHGRWHPLLRVALYFAAFVAAVVLLSPLVLPLAPPQGADLAEALDLQSPFTIASAWLILAAALIVTYLATRFLDRQAWRATGLWPHPGWPSETLAGVAAGAVLIGGVFLVILATDTGGTSRGTATAARAVLVGVAALLPWALTEELLVRGYVLRNLAQAWGAVPALFVSAVIFSVLHLKSPEVGALALLNIALVGVLLGYAYLMSGSLWFPFGFHFAWNFVQGSLLGMPVSGLGVPNVIQTNLSNVGVGRWLTGGPFGPEAGLLGTLALAAGMAYAVRRYGPPQALPQRQAPAEHT